MEQGTRWTAKRKAELVLSLVKGERSIVDVCRAHDLRQSQVEDWVETFLKGGEERLKVNSKDARLEHEREVTELRAKVGELVLELDARKKLQALIDQEETGS